ncbi:hypothetical protein ACFL6S_25405 [Candidatus Poribacteria bacterium]
MERVITMGFLLIFFSLASAFAEQLYWNDFEGEFLETLPHGWTRVFKGDGKAKVIADPSNPQNKIFASSDLPGLQARHDVGGAIFAVGEDSWKDYIVEYDAYFPEEFYAGVLFRFQNSEAFYMFERRSGGEKGKFDFWKHTAGNWSGFERAGVFQAEPQKWYRFRLVVKGDTFQAYGKSKADKTPFTEKDLILTGNDSSFETGKFGLYALIYIDNLVIGETEEDLARLLVEPRWKFTTTWGSVKAE